MAIYHLNAKVISRGKGQSAIAAAAYRSGERLYDEQAGQQKYYTSRAERIVLTDIMAPKDAPEWAHDRNALWNHAERAEKRKDAQLAREFEISLPHELTDRQREWLVKDFAREAFVRKGYAVDIAIHAPDKESDERNHHAHLMVTRRTLGPDGFSKTKDWQFDKKQLGAWREQWAHLANRHLERHGHEARIDHRSLKEQGVDREATVHLGHAANEMTQRGAHSDRMDTLRAILARNEIRLDLKALAAELVALEKAQAGQAARATPPGERAMSYEEEYILAQAEARRAAAAEAASRQAAPAPALQEPPRDIPRPATQRPAESRPPRQEAAARAGQPEAKAPAPAIAPAWQAGMQFTYGPPGDAAGRHGARSPETPAPVAAPAQPALPLVPIEHIHARHAAAEAERANAAAERARAEAMRKLAAAARQDEAALRRPDSPERAFGDNAREGAQQIRQERRDEKFWADQKAWQERVKAQQPAGARAAPVRSGLRVAGAAAGMATGLADFVGGLLSGATDTARPPGGAAAGTRAFVTDPAARREQQLARIAAKRQAEADREALESIREDMEAGRNLKPEDIKKLTHDHLTQIYHKGDEALRQMTEEARKRSERYWKGDERERD